MAPPIREAVLRRVQEAVNDAAENQSGAAVGAVIDALGFPAAIVDAGKRVVHANRLFLDLLACDTGERMWRRLRIDTASGSGTRFVVDLGDGAAGPRIVGVRALAGCNHKAYLVAVSTAGPADPTLEGDITPAEQAVLFGMLAGRNLAGIARDRGTKVSTVRWHLKNIQSKLGMTDKAEVIAWIARSPVCWLAGRPDPGSDA
ncbi:helix-turn-helix transcriptional regulator [Thalassobaculum sp. OXR-137]|uniref:helix-turn-helix transcriptional regulator n=1 Tax=Thalassobaculum sp. OXR-137 TaxID=3100173 RepID=UPI002AC9D520|nr:helix-turn-helix transcriptional regulator [Thalassobaculum sp. OXR-137]WPZ33316.1 helix-turn-helix transcriptional regulator [Thalassobaculum sp. OXR-137]